MDWAKPGKKLGQGKEMGSALDMGKKWGQPLTWDIMLAMVNIGGIILDYGQTTEN